MLTLMYITNSPEVALIAQRYGVDRIWVDLETLGKEERQKGMNTVKSRHTVADAAALRPLLTKSELLVRVNPINENSRTEIDAVTATGADLIMLPMWKTADEVRCFIDMVGGRARTVLLLETREAAACLDEVLTIRGVDEIHIGLNDLHLSCGKRFMFQLLTDGTVESLCGKIRAAGIPYGFGGVAKIGDGMLPAQYILAEHARLGSTRAILSRTFCDNAMIDNIEEIDRVFRLNMKLLRDTEKQISRMDESELEENRLETVRIVDEIVHILEKRNQ